MTAYSDAIAAAKARLAGADAVAADTLAVDFGAADEHTTGGGDATAHQDFSRIVADATRGVDGEGDKAGAPDGQQET